MGAGMAVKPGGRVTQVFERSAQRQGAYGLLENQDVRSGEVGRAIYQACAARCAGQPWVLVPIDGSSLKLSDKNKDKGFGPIGALAKGARGVKMINAIAVTEEGTPQGLCGQVYWVRKEEAVQTPREKRTVQEKETRYWIETMGQVRAAFGAQAPKTKPWFQIDREGDAWPILQDAKEHQDLLTVRVAHDRRLESEPGTDPSYLWEKINRQEPLGRYALDVPASPTRQARRAIMEVRVQSVVLSLRDRRTGKRFSMPIAAVGTREIGTTPQGEQPLEWFLFTTYLISDFADACLVVWGYAQRWRVEEFHRAWKSGACRVEESQLRTLEAVQKWAMMLSAVAMRILRLTYLSRSDPQCPATVELTREEIAAAQLLRQMSPDPNGPVPPLSQVVLWIAELGGYTGKSSGGPPGMIVIARGLQRIEPVAKILRHAALLASMQM
jgi:Transposase DDE domain